MLTPTPMQTDSARPIRELEPIVMPPPVKAKRGLPTWVTIVAFVAAGLLLVAAIGLYMSRADAIDSRNAAQAQVDQLQNQVTTLQTQTTGLQTQVTDMRTTNTALNAKVDACQTAYKIDVMVGLGTMKDTPATFAKWTEAMNACYGTIFPGWMG